MADENCSYYHSVKNLASPIKEGLCDSIIRSNALGNYEEFGEHARNLDCLCNNHKTCYWYLAEKREERNKEYTENDVPGLLW